MYIIGIVYIIIGNIKIVGIVQINVYHIIGKTYKYAKNNIIL